MREYNKNYYASNAERERNRVGKYRADNPDKVRSARRGYYLRWYATHGAEFNAQRNVRARAIRDVILKTFFMQPEDARQDYVDGLMSLATNDYKIKYAMTYYSVQYNLGEYLDDWYEREVIPHGG